MAGQGASGTLAPMVHAQTPGESAGHRARWFPVLLSLLSRGAGAFALFLGLSVGLVGPAAAGTLYRCVGATGETVFSGSTAGYKECKRIGSTPQARPARAAASNGAIFEPVAAEKPSLTGVTGGVMTTANVPPVAPGLPLASEAPPAAGTSKPARPKGTWDYQESSSSDLGTLKAPEPAKGSRVLRGAVYRITRADGGVEYTNIPQAGGAKGQSIKMLFTYIATCAACDVHSRVNWNSVTLNLDAYGDVIRAASGEYGVDEALLRAVIHAESAFNPRALSVAGAQGLMQLIPGTARDMGVLDAFDVGQNIRGGARYLALLLRSFNGNERLAAAAYNAGPGAVQKYNGVPPYDETQVYVERVSLLRKRYGESLKAHPAANTLPATL